MNLAVDRRIVFSVLFNESDDYIPRIIDNFLGYTDKDVFLVINLPPDRKIFLGTNSDSDRVFLINGSVHRAKLGHTLLFGHLEAFDYAVTAVRDFEFFCPLASNSLLFRPFDKNATLRQLEIIPATNFVSLDNLPTAWWWAKVNNNNSFTTFLRDRWGLKQLSGNQIEGLFASREDWGTLHVRMSEISELGATIDPEISFPLEEILPSTFFHNFGSGRFTYICHNFWDHSVRRNGLAHISDFLGMPSEFPTHICVLKWFRRSRYAVETIAVTQGWSRSLLANLSALRLNGSNIDLLVQRALLAGVEAELRKGENFIPAATGWWPVNESGQQSLSVSEKAVQAVGQHLILVNDRDERPIHDPAYVWLESTQDVLDLHIRIEHKIETRIIIECSSSPPSDLCDASQFLLEGYLYFRLIPAPGKCIFRLRTQMPDTDVSRQASERIVLAHAGQHRITPPLQNIEAGAFREYFYEHEAKDGADVWFGIPILSNTSFVGFVDFIVDVNHKLAVTD